MEEKECLICEKVKPLTDFHRHSGKPDGRRNDCKLCRKNKVKRDRNPEFKRCSRCKEKRPNNSEHFWTYPNKTAKTRYRSQCIECHKKANGLSHIKRLYGITENDLDKMKKQQNLCCAICGKGKKLYVDHCHNTGRIRGLLCDTCNRGIGFLQEDKDILLGALKYLFPEKEKEKEDGN
jgi:hypothetical protein